MDLRLTGKHAVVTGGSRGIGFAIAAALASEGVDLHQRPGRPQREHAIGLDRNVAIAALTKTLADELGPAGVNVTVVHPGLTATERTPAMIAGYAAASGSTEAEAEVSLAAGISIGRIITAAEVADVAAFLASPRSVAINGDAIAVGGGAPGAIHY